MKNNQCFYPRGKAMGGTTAINGIVYARGNKYDFDLWEEMGNTGWSYNDVLPVFKRQETSYVDSDEGYHGYNGPLLTNYTFGDSKKLPIYLKACNQMGYENIDINGNTQYGCSKIPTNIDKNKRISSNTAFIESIKDTRSNLKISKLSMVTRLLINEDNNTTYGVEFIKDKQKYHATVNKEVILSAGAINTPQILMLSGIGPKDELLKNNIKCINDLPVGKYLQEHPVCTGVNIKTNLTEESYLVKISPLTFTEQVKQYIRYNKPLTSAFGTELISFINGTKNTVNRPDMELLSGFPQLNNAISYFFLNYKDDTINNFIKKINPVTDYAILLTLLHEKSRGTITLKSNSPKDFPNIYLNLFSDDKNEDLDTFYDGLLYVKQMLQTDAFKSINAKIMNPRGICDEFEDDSKDYWLCLFRKLSTTLWHTVGTARMGNSTTDSVVNNKLEVHGMNGLRVVDASIMPEVISGHSGAASMMIGGRAGDLIKEKYGS